MAAVVFVTTSMLTWLPKYFEKVREIPQETAGKMAGAVMLLALIGAPLGGYLTDKWRKTRESQTIISGNFNIIISFSSFCCICSLKGTVQYIVLLIFGILILVIYFRSSCGYPGCNSPGLRATSYAIAVVVQNLLGASTAPVIMGKIYDLQIYRQLLSVLPFVLLVGAFLFWIGSRYYVNDLEKVANKLSSGYPE